MQIIEYATQCKRMIHHNFFYFLLPLSLSTSFEHQCAKRNTLRVPGSLEKFQNPLFNWNPPIFLHSFYTDNI